jgi:hypothetical protein
MKCNSERQSMKPTGRYIEMRRARMMTNKFQKTNQTGSVQALSQTGDFFFSPGSYE